MAQPSTTPRAGAGRDRAGAYNAAMFKWLLVVVLCCVVFSALRPWLARFGLGRMPGDFRFRVRGTEIFLPLGSIVCFSLLFWLVGRLI